MSTAYAFDPTGIAPANLVSKEIHVASESTFFNTAFIVPQYAPFFNDSVTIQAKTNGVSRNLVLGTDYDFCFFFKAASYSIQKKISGGIRLTAGRVAPADTILVSYQTLGGEWTVDSSTVLNNLLEQGYIPVLSVWDILTEYQHVFPVINKTRVFDPNTQAQSLIQSINDLAVAIAKQDRLSQIIHHLSDFNNPHQDTAATFGLQDMENIPVASALDISNGATERKYITFDQLNTMMTGVSGSGQSGGTDAGLNVRGPLSIMSGAPTNYRISDYDSRMTYTVTPDMGTAQLNGDTILYTPPLLLTKPLDIGGFVLNSKDHPVTIKQTELLNPSIIFPAAGALIIDSVTFNSSPLATNGGPDTHVSSTWQLATDAGFTTIIQNSNADTVNKTAWKVSGLSLATTYYARVKYTSATLGDTGWSSVYTFTTSTTATVSPTTVVQTLNPADMSAADVVAGDGTFFGLGTVLSEDGSIMAIGCSQKLVSGVRMAGEICIYSYQNGQYVQFQTLVEPTPVENNHFGNWMAMSADGKVLVAINGDVIAKTYIYRFDGTSFQLEKTLSMEGVRTGLNQYNDQISISSDGNTILFPYVDGNNTPESPLTFNFATYTYANGDWTGIFETVVGISEIPLALVSYNCSWACNADCTVFATSVETARSTNFIHSGIYVYVFKKVNGQWVFFTYGDDPAFYGTNIQGSDVISSIVTIDKQGENIAISRVGLAHNQAGVPTAEASNLFLGKIGSNGITINQTLTHNSANIGNPDPFCVLMDMTFSGKVLAIFSIAQTPNPVGTIDFYSTSDGVTWVLKNSITVDPTVTAAFPKAFDLSGDGAVALLGSPYTSYTNSNGTLNMAGTAEVYR
jgi:hypothetical protein